MVSSTPVATNRTPRARLRESAHRATRNMAHDGESDLIVQQLERGLPRWEGFGDFGWLEEKEGSEDRWLELVLAIKGHKDAVYVSPSILPPLPQILGSFQW